MIYLNAVDSIEIETTNKLHFEYGIRLEDIDSTHILANKLLNGTDKSGLIHNAGQRLVESSRRRFKT